MYASAPPLLPAHVAEKAACKLVPGPDATG